MSTEILFIGGGTSVKLITHTYINSYSIPDTIKHANVKPIVFCLFIINTVTLIFKKMNADIS